MFDCVTVIVSNSSSVNSYPACECLWHITAEQYLHGWIELDDDQQIDKYINKTMHGIMTIYISASINKSKGTDLYASSM